MKPQLRWIPTEVWVDVFRYPGKSRKELGGIVDQIGNCKFAEFLQFYLHEWGKRTSDTLYLDKRTLPDIPWTPVPENIKFFKRISIWHFDSSALAFLRTINTLFNGVNLRFTGNWTNNDLTNYRTILDHLSPLINGIHSIQFNDTTIPLVQQYFGNKLAHIKMLKLNLYYGQATIQTSINFCLNWLILEERDPAEPRFLKINFGSGENFQQFCIALRQQFLSANSPCTFAIGIICHDTYDQLANFHLENNLGEQLDQFGAYSPRKR